MSEKKFSKGEIIDLPCQIIQRLTSSDKTTCIYVVTFDIEEGSQQSAMPVDLQKIGVNKIPEEERETCKQIACDFIAAKKSGYGNIKAVRNASLDEGMLEIWKLHNIDKYSYEIIDKVLNVAVRDTFWAKNLLTLSNVRKKCKNELTKFENVKIRLDSLPHTRSLYSSLD